MSKVKQKHDPHALDYEPESFVEFDQARGVIWLNVPPEVERLNSVGARRLALELNRLATRLEAQEQGRSKGRFEGRARR